MPSRPVSRAVLLAGAAVAGATAVGYLLRQRREAAVHEADASWSRLPEGHALVLTTADGAELAVTVAGPDDAPTVVLAHCWTGMRSIWAIVARVLADHGHRVVLYDQRGHGHSTLGDEPPSIAVLAHDLRTVLEAVDARDIVLAGHSMGGMSIQSYALEHPDDFAERVRAVVLVATAARVIGRALPERLVHGLMADGRAEWTRRGPVGTRVVRGALGQRAQPEHVAMTLEGYASTSGAARAGFALAMATMDLRAAGPILAAVPTTVMVGTRDTLTPPRLARQLVAGIPGATLEVIPRAGHMLPLERPEEIVTAIEASTRQSVRAASG